MKLIQTAKQQEATYSVGDEIIFTQSIFDGRTTHQAKVQLRITKVNKVTLIAEDKTGNVYKLDPREGNITTRDQFVASMMDSIA